MTISTSTIINSCEGFRADHFIASCMLPEGLSMTIKLGESPAVGVGKLLPAQQQQKQSSQQERIRCVTPVHDTMPHLMCQAAPGRNLLESTSQIPGSPCLLLQLVQCLLLLLPILLLHDCALLAGWHIRPMGVTCSPGLILVSSHTCNRTEHTGL